MPFDPAPLALVIVLAAALDAAFVAVAFGLRTWLQLRHFGDGGWRLGRPSSAVEAAARLLLVGAGAALGAAVVHAGVAGTSTSWPALVGGTAVAAGAIGLTTLAQLQMGESWRIGLDPDERTALVTGGLYRRVRNPIYTGMVAFAAGQALLLGGWLAWVATAALVAGAQVQVRAVEEPYLDRLHGARYRRWAARAGRFLPGVGRLDGSVAPTIPTGPTSR